MTAPPSLSNARYLVPNWFLERNVKTAAELSAAPDQIVLCTCGDCKEAKADDDGEGTDHADDECPEKDKAVHDAGKDVVKELNDSWSSSLAEESCPDEIKYKTFAELRDITAAAFAIDRDGKLLRPEASAVIFRMEKEEWDEYGYECTTSFMELVWMGRAVERVAKTLGVSLVTLNLEDLEELGRDFHRQDKEAQKCKTSGDVAISLVSTSETHEKDAKEKQDGSTTNTTLIEGSENNDQEAGEAEDVDDNNEDTSSTGHPWEPDVCSLSAFLSHFFAARSERHADVESWQRTQLVWTLILDAVKAKLVTENIASEMKSGIFCPSALIFHITDYPNLDEYRLKRRVLTRFAEMVQQRRKQGDAVAMIVSTDDTSLGPDEKLSRKIGAGRASNIVVRDVISDAVLATRKQSYTGIINTRALRRCLREFCSHLFLADLLKVTADWACAERGKSFTSRDFGGKLWTSTEMGNVVTQLLGRAWLKPNLSFADVRVVLNRLGLYNPVEPETEDTPESGNTPEATTTEEDVSEILRELDLNSYEQELTQCIVDPGTLKTRWDDVIIDQETKETMQQFVASHSLQFDCASEFLRDALRIRGALLYGPPGTGKTQLSRAVATSSGSRMLAVSYSSLISKWVSESEKIIEAAFTLAGKLHPCVLFMDEVDSLFYRRSSGDKSWERSQINQFLLQMDGLSQNDKAPLVLVATNRPWDLDEAFLRRLQHKVYLGLPDIEARARILGLFLHPDDLDPTVDINGLAQVTEKYSGSDLKTLCAKAGLLWEAEQARLHTLYKSVSDKFAMASNAPKKVRLGIDHFAKALDEIQPSNSEGLAEGLEGFRKTHNPTASTSGRDPGIRFVYNSSTKRYDRFGVRALISRIPVSDDVSVLKQYDPEDEMQLQSWCQLELHAHIVRWLNTRLAVLLFCFQRVLEHEMQLQAWCQIDLRMHLMHRLHTNLIALLFCLHTCGHYLPTLQQAPLHSEDSTAAGSNTKTRKKTRKTAPRNKSKLKESASAAETENSHYTTLGTDEFRLLEIAPGDVDAPLVCTLKHASFQSNERYCALSYTWGSPEPPFYVKCNGGDIRITRSLHEALCRMRRTWFPVMVWADAICINQSDNSEKSQQVIRMGEIYSKASRLFIWLGNPLTPSDADVTVDTMEKLGRIVQAIRDENEEEAWHRGGFIVAMQEGIRAEAISETEWQKLQDCFLMPWFSRVWVFQEVASVMRFSDDNIRVGYGNREFAWTTVVDIMAILGPFKTANPVSVRCPYAVTMERNIRMESWVRRVHIHLPNDQITEEDVAEALARKPFPDGRTLQDYSRFGGLVAEVAIVIDLCKFTSPNASEDSHLQLDSDKDAALMMEAVLRIFPQEFRAMGEKLSRDINVNWLAQSALGWCVQCSPDDEWWLPENPAVLKLRRSVGFVTASLLKQPEPYQVIDVVLKTATFSFMPGLKQKLWSRLQLARRLGATDLRDKLYAFLGIYSEDVADEPLLKVDYTLSVADVYINLTVFFLQRLMCLDVLEFVNDMPTRTPCLANLPSWAIDLSSATDLELFQNNIYYNAGGACSLGIARFPMHVLQVNVSDDRRRLDLNAYFVGEVTALGLLPHHYKQNVQLTGNNNHEDHENTKAAASRTYGLALNMIHKLGQSTRDLKDFNIDNPAVNNFPAPPTFDMPSRLYLTGQSMFEIFWRCLVCDRWTYQMRHDDDVSLDERKLEMEQAYRNYHTMIANGSTGLDPPAGDGDATSECFDSPGSTPTEPDPDIYFFSTEFEPQARTSVFGVVADELIGWFPRRAEKGDMLVVLPGARCPYVLRKVQGGASMDWNKAVNEDDPAQKQDQRSEWKVIGHAYVQGLMDDIVTEWQIELTENGRELLGKLNANSGEAPAVERICLV